MRYASLYEAQFAARYGARYCQKVGRIWGRLATLIAFCELIGGSAAFGAFLANNQALGAYTGLLLAVCAALNHSVRPAEKAKDARIAFGKFMALTGDEGLDLEAMNRDLTALQSEDDGGFEFIRETTYNEVAREWGRDDYIKPPPWWQRVMGLFA